MSSEFLYVSIASIFGFAMLLLMLVFIYYMIFYNQPVYKQTYQKVKTSDEEDRVEKVKDSKHE
jgi:CHASE3 domain sensor protein